jgi:hypothetical protein
MLKHAIKIGIFTGLAIAAFGTIIMLLWNWLIPELFAGPILTFCEALGILLLSKILFGSWKCGWGCHSHCYGGNCHSGKHSYWKNKMEQRIKNMSPEEKEKFKQKYAKCGLDVSSTMNNENI